MENLKKKIGFFFLKKIKNKIKEIEKLEKKT